MFRKFFRTVLREARFKFDRMLSVVLLWCLAVNACFLKGFVDFYDARRSGVVFS